MRRILLAFGGALLFLAGTANAQLTLTAINPPAVVNGPTNQGALVAAFDVQNTGTQPLKIKVKRQIITEITGSDNNFCWAGNCYGPNVSISPDAETIAPGATSNSFIADYNPNGNAGTTTIKYCFFLESDATKETCVTIDFKATNTTGLTAQNNKPNYISEIYPNPVTTTEATINYNLPASARSAKLVLYNAIGSVVKEVNLKAGQGSVLLPLEGLPNGIYFYTLEVNQKSIDSKKLIIRR